MRPYLFDMETNDPDDMLTMVLLLGHPEVNLQAVTVTPGTKEQVGLVRQILALFNREDVRVGVTNIEHVGHCVSAWHYNGFPELHRVEDDNAEVGWELLDELFVVGTTLVCGAALPNVGKMVESGESIPRGRLFIQGGFAGEGVVPPEKQLDKFKGRVACPSFNLDGDKTSAKNILSTAGSFEDLRCASKNVCHGILFNQQMYDECEGMLNPASSAHALSWKLIMQGMGYYIQKKPRGKAFHDPFAACCAINPDIASWERVSLTREKDGWMSTLNADSKVKIVTDYDREAFLKVLTGTPP